MFDAAFFFFNWTLSYKPINIISIIITPSSLCKIIYHYMKSNLFPIWKAPRSSWVLLEKTTTDKSEETKIKTEKKRVTSHSPALYLCRIYFLLYAFYCFDQPNCKCPWTVFPPLSWEDHLLLWTKKHFMLLSTWFPFLALITTATLLLLAHCCLRKMFNSKSSQKDTL